ncbi:hypothetical protein [Methanobrevibacter sp.]|uniref:hypothetical protein n=1 Tax=Methanobrevibacter sp. TaxID=66852 RepID=UPI0025E97C50|nr:hypothetical protein [Methanobrevibacter sp.]
MKKTLCINRFKYFTPKDTFQTKLVLEIINVIKETTDLHINCRLNAFDGTHIGMTLD